MKYSAPIGQCLSRIILSLKIRRVIQPYPRRGWGQPKADVAEGSEAKCGRPHHSIFVSMKFKRLLKSFKLRYITAFNTAYTCRSSIT